MLLGKMPWAKSNQSKEDNDLQYDDDMQGVQCKNGVNRLAVFGAEGKQCAAMPHQLPQEKFQPLTGRGLRERGYTIALTKKLYLKNIGRHTANRHTA